MTRDIYETDYYRKGENAVLVVGSLVIPHQLLCSLFFSSPSNCMDQSPRELDGCLANEIPSIL
jgi:hypothetical protein